MGFESQYLKQIIDLSSFGFFSFWFCGMTSSTILHVFHDDEDTREPSAYLLRKKGNLLPSGVHVLHAENTTYTNRNTSRRLLTLAQTDASHRELLRCARGQDRQKSQLQITSRLVTVQADSLSIDYSSKHSSLFFLTMASGKIQLFTLGTPNGHKVCTMPGSIPNLTSFPRLKLTTTIFVLYFFSVSRITRKLDVRLLSDDYFS